MNDRFVTKRYLNIVYLFSISFFGTILTALLHEKYIDEILVYLVIDVVFMLLLWFVLEHSRIQRAISGNLETTFRKLVNAYLVCWIFVLLSSFLPEFIKPMLVIPLVMTAFGTQSIAMYVSISLNVIICMILGSSIQELILYMLLTMFGCMLAEDFQNSNCQIWYEIIIVAVSMVFPPLFYYLTYSEVEYSLLILGALEGIVLALALHMFYKRIVLYAQEEVSNLLEDMLDDDYALKRELLEFSETDYIHAKRVSEMAVKCARLVDADERLCAAAGFYYRIGILEGDSIAANGSCIAQEECFPEDMSRIISEYNGEQALPSSVESAVVHMVDAVIKKLELFDSDVMSNDWNQNMVIYQTLNDFSSQGLYDKSGLTMNMFLKIREYLINEEALL